MYLHTSAYSFHKGVPFSVYGENVVILIQNLIIISLFWNYNKGVSRNEKVLCSVFFLLYTLTLVFMD